MILGKAKYLQADLRKVFCYWLYAKCLLVNRLYAKWEKGSNSQ